MQLTVILFLFFGAEALRTLAAGTGVVWCAQCEHGKQCINKQNLQVVPGIASFEECECVMIDSTADCSTSKAEKVWQILAATFAVGCLCYCGAFAVFWKLWLKDSILKSAWFKRIKEEQLRS